MKIIFAGTPEFAVAPLLALLAEHQVVAVFTQPDRRSGRGKKLAAPPVKEIALRHNIPVFQPTSLVDQVSLITKMDADVMVVVAYGMLLPQSILGLPEFGCINIHASILPRWRGAAPIQRSIEAGDTQTGVSIMQMQLGLDTGAVYEVLKTEITATDTSETLHQKLSDLGALGIISTLAKLQSDPATNATKQEESKSSYAKKIIKTEANIDWAMSAERIDARIRAFIPWPVCQSYHRSNKIRVWRASIITIDNGTGLPFHISETSIGCVVKIDVDGVIIACGEGFLRLEVLQRDGSKALPFNEFCNGYPFVVGDRFIDPAANQQGHNV
ncbi:MAG: methionyl-tRNA formyltransferase [Arenicella sp.]|jgi:methionyl-tRNA formyltransferase